MDLNVDDLTSIVEKPDIEHVVNNERDVSKDRDIELIVRWSSKNEDVLFNVLDVLDLMENALVHFNVLDALDLT